MAEAQMVVGCEARRYKDSNAREPWWNYLKLFYIVKASPKQFFVFFFVLFFFLFEIIAMATAAAASSLLIVLSVEIKIKEFK